MMHTIFRTTAQALRFAFAFEQYPFGGPASSETMVRVALAEVGQSAAVVLAEHTPEQLRAQARCLLVRVGADLLAIERAAVVATWSRNWVARRGAVATLQRYYLHPLARLIDDTKLIDQLVMRHYLAAHDRGAGWSLDEIADQFKVGRDRVRRAASLIDTHARQLERAALTHLDTLLLSQQEEAAHA